MKKQFILFYITLIVAAPICFGQASPPTSAKFGQASLSKPDKFAKEAEITDLEKAAWEADRQARKEWEKSRFDEYTDKLTRMWQ